MCGADRPTLIPGLRPPLGARDPRRSLARPWLGAIGLALLIAAVPALTLATPPTYLAFVAHRDSPDTPWRTPPVLNSATDAVPAGQYGFQIVILHPHPAMLPAGLRLPDKRAWISLHGLVTIDPAGRSTGVEDLEDPAPSAAARGALRFDAPVWQAESYLEGWSRRGRPLVAPLAGFVRESADPAAAGRDPDLDTLRALLLPDADIEFTVPPAAADPTEDRMTCRLARLHRIAPGDAGPVAAQSVSWLWDFWDPAASARQGQPGRGLADLVSRTQNLIGKDPGQRLAFRDAGYTAAADLHQDRLVRRFADFLVTLNPERDPPGPEDPGRAPGPVGPAVLPGQARPTPESGSEWWRDPVLYPLAALPLAIGALALVVIRRRPAPKSAATPAARDADAPRRRTPTAIRPAPTPGEASAPDRTDDPAPEGARLAAIERQLQGLAADLGRAHDQTQGLVTGLIRTTFDQWRLETQAATGGDGGQEPDRATVAGQLAALQQRLSAVEDRLAAVADQLAAHLAGPDTVPAPAPPAAAATPHADLPPGAATPPAPPPATIPAPARAALEALLDRLGLTAAQTRAALWDGAPSPLALALRLALQPRLAGLSAQALAPLQDWLQTLPGDRLALIVPAVGERCDERLHEINPVAGERLPFEHVVRIDRLGLLAGGRVQIKARVDVHR